MSAGRFLCLILPLLVVLHVEPVSDPQVIKAKPGENVTLPCQAPKGNIGLLAWKRMEPKSEKYLLYDRDDMCCAGYQDPLFQDRVDLNNSKMENGDGSVVLKNITTGDSGIYECRIGEENAELSEPKLINTIHLMVEDPGPTAGKQGGNRAPEIGLPIGLLLVIFVPLAIVVTTHYK